MWTELSRRLANLRDPAALCAATSRLVAETFDVLSVTIWVPGEEKEQFVVGASTGSQPREGLDDPRRVTASSAVTAGLRLRSSPFDLETVNEAWAEEFRRLNPAAFSTGGNRLCVPLRVGDQSLGALVLADRVNGAGYTAEELGLLTCVADHVTSVLLNLQLADEVVRAREREAFRTMSAFFVHDLKNAAASLNLTLRNLPVHFDDPAFRADALRAIGNTARRIDDLIARLTALRQRPDLHPVDTDLNQLVGETLETLDGLERVDLTKELHPLPTIRADREQIRSVVTNLVLNARDALGPGGRIAVRTEPLDGVVVLTVADNGCGMSPAFVKDSLFRPFHSTKAKGLGIGMFQSRMVVEAHGGGIQVESEAGRGTTCRVRIPVHERT
jgi:putative PEP-CTERM system histidine kinase